MRRREPTPARAALARLVGVLVLLGAAHGQNDRSGNFPPKVSVPISAPGGTVTGLSTTVYVSSQQGEIFLADIKSGNGTLLNTGGDGQTLGGLCRDSREGQTLYGAGRETGLLYAFDAEGKLRRRLVITGKSSEDEKHFIAHCVQSRYYLIVVDAYQDKLFKLDLADKGPQRGMPPPLRDGDRDATMVRLGGDWKPARKGKLGPISVEWSQKWNETGFLLNHDTGRVYLFNLNATGTAKLREMKIGGKQTSFPGSTHMLFDSVNERILYLSQPARNAIAVIEINEEKPTSARYIRTLTSPLINSPLASAEFGESLHVLNIDLGARDRMDGRYSLVKIPKHVQELADDFDEDEPFTPVADGDDPPQEAQYDEPTLTGVITAPPKKVGEALDAPTDEEIAPDERTPSSKTKEGKEKERKEKEREGTDTAVPSDLPSVFDSDFKGDDDGERSCFPADATVDVRGRGIVPMADLEVGDEVLVAPEKYSPVFMFTHRERTFTSEFVKIDFGSGSGASRSLVLSPGHYIYVNDALRPASSVEVGDILSLASASSTSPLSFPYSSAAVTSIERVQRSGLYNPQTVSGDIVVGGVLASTYTTAVEPSFAHAILTPLRSLQKLGIHLNLLESGGGFLCQFMPRGDASLALS